MDREDIEGKLKQILYKYSNNIVSINTDGEDQIDLTVKVQEPSDEIDEIVQEVSKLFPSMENYYQVSYGTETTRSRFGYFADRN